MENKFNTKYRAGSCRLKSWDYSRGNYFITICTKSRKPYFGNLQPDGKMIHSIAGDYTLRCLYSIPYFNPYVKVDQFIIMPDHLHVILMLECQDNDSGNHNRFGPQSKNLASVIRGFKSSVTIFTKKHNIEFSWQPGFYDRIIRNGTVMDRIRNYIMNNPIKHAGLKNSGGNL